jgi:cytoskeletal protein RodZ
MAGADPDDYDDEQSPSDTPWYNRTPNVIGASVAGIALIGILIAAVTFVGRQFNEPQEAPLNYVDPTYSATASHPSSTPTTTATITTTSPPVTTDINGPSSTTSSTDTSSTDTTSTTSTTHTAWTQPYTPPRGEESGPSTTRRGPRTNVTRTLYPQP